jgi:hypothetical protein
MSSWKVSPILAPLIADVKREFPGIVIGTIGDPAHRAEKTGSDHNPDQYGFVCAADFMYGHGFGATQAEALFRRLIALRDSRLAYEISNRQIVSATVQPYKVRAYTGTDPHTGHVHVSVNHAQSPRPTTSWNVYPPALEDDMPSSAEVVKALLDQKLGSSGPTVAVALQSGYRNSETALEQIEDLKAAVAELRALVKPGA